MSAGPSAGFCDKSTRGTVRASFASMRPTAVAVLLLSLVVAACALGAAAPTTSPPTTAAERERFLTMFARAYVPKRSGQLFLVPQEHSFFLSRTALEFERFMHGSPWDYDTRIPILFYGPGHIRSGTYTRPARPEDIAPTILGLVKLPLPGMMTGDTLSEAIAAATAPPDLVVVIVLDAMGRATWESNQRFIPTLSRLRANGAWFENARLDYLPSVTATGHATVSTGTEPWINGIHANSSFTFRTPRDPFGGMKPDSYLVPTLSDYWNLWLPGAVIVAQGSTTRATVALAGHGKGMGGHKTLMTMFDEKRVAWQTDTTNFRELPPYLARDTTNALDSTRLARHQIRWMSHPVDSGNALIRTGLFPEFQMNALLEVVRNERLGRHRAADLLLVNCKTPDYVSHLYGPQSAEMHSALQALDGQLARLVKALDDSVGTGHYVIAITADHGMPPETTTTSRRIYVQDLAQEVDAKLGASVLSDTLHAWFDAGSAQIDLSDSVLTRTGKTLPQIQKLLEADPYVRYVFTEQQVADAARRLKPGRHR